MTILQQNFGLGIISLRKMVRVNRNRILVKNLNNSSVQIILKR